MWYVAVCACKWTSVAHSTHLQEQTLARSTFSGNYTLIRDLYTEGGGNFTAIVPRDMYAAVVQRH